MIYILVEREVSQMDVNQLAQFIMNNGFAVVMCVLLLKRMDKEAERHKEEIDSLKEGLDKINSTINHFYDRLINKSVKGDDDV